MPAAMPALLGRVETAGTWQSNRLPNAGPADSDVRSMHTKTERWPGLRKIDRDAWRDAHAPEKPKVSHPMPSR